jgi:hypothetical protein
MYPLIFNSVSNDAEDKIVKGVDAVIGIFRPEARPTGSLSARLLCAETSQRQF